MTDARSRWMDEQGIHGANRRAVLDAIALAGDSGQCGREGERTTGLTHQSYSGARSWLHRHGHIHRLTEKREGGSVYVTLLYVNGRPTEPFKPHGKAGEPDWLKRLRADLEAHLGWEGEPVEVRTAAGGWRDLIDYLPEEATDD